MKTSSVFLPCVLLLAFLSACASAPTATPPPTATTPPTATATTTNTPTPTATATPTATPTPSRTLTAAESRAASLRPLSGFSWRADGDSVKLYDAKGEAVAVLDTKSGALRWDSKNQKHFAAIEPYLGANYQNRAELVKWLSDLKAQGIHFITFPDSREGFPPYIVIPTADGKDVQMISARKGTADFVYNADAKKVMGVFPDGSGYYFLNPDGSFDLTPLDQQINALVKSLPIQFSNQEDQKLVTDAIVQAFKLAPFDEDIANQVNAAMGTRNGVDFRTYFNQLYKEKYKVDFDDLVNKYAKIFIPSQFPYRNLAYIGPTKTPACKMTCYGSDGIDREDVEIHQRDIEFKRDLTSLLYKELIGTNILNDLWYHQKLWRIDNSGDTSHMAEMISYGLKVNFMIKNNINPDMIEGERTAGWNGGYLFP